MTGLVSPTVSNAIRGVCAQCGLPFTGARSTRRYCSDACRQARWRGDSPKDTLRACAAVDCIGDGWVPLLARRDARYCCPKCRDRDYFAYARPLLPRRWTATDAAFLSGLGVS